MADHQPTGRVEPSHAGHVGDLGGLVHRPRQHCRPGPSTDDDRGAALDRHRLQRPVVTGPGAQECHPRSVRRDRRMRAVLGAVDPAHRLVAQRAIPEPTRVARRLIHDEAAARRDGEADPLLRRHRSAVGETDIVRDRPRRRRRPRQCPHQRHPRHRSDRRDPDAARIARPTPLAQHDLAGHTAQRRIRRIRQRVGERLCSLEAIGRDLLQRLRHCR